MRVGAYSEVAQAEPPPSSNARGSPRVAATPCVRVAQRHPQVEVGVRRWRRVVRVPRVVGRRHVVAAPEGEGADGRQEAQRLHKVEQRAHPGREGLRKSLVPPRGVRQQHPEAVREGGGDRETCRASGGRDGGRWAHSLAVGSLADDPRWLGWGDGRTASEKNGVDDGGGELIDAVGGRAVALCELGAVDLLHHRPVGVRELLVPPHAAEHVGQEGEEALPDRDREVDEEGRLNEEEELHKLHLGGGEGVLLPGESALK
mmetsp:Transcript_24868/g.74335  ORF Transcript_24868/g.74335 Transcript_24868/m.74335 type:complete len:259 (+) Transcript_24868:619-1395(+)